MDFNSRPREGGRPLDLSGWDVSSVFQFTPPRRGATGCPGLHGATPNISIHAPAKGGDRLTSTAIAAYVKFQFTPPRRGATVAGFNMGDMPSSISIHAPAKGGDHAAGSGGGVVVISIHAPAKGATTIENFLRVIENISIHAPAKGATLPLVVNTPV